MYIPSIAIFYWAVKGYFGQLAAQGGASFAPSLAAAMLDQHIEFTHKIIFIHYSRFDTIYFNWELSVISH